MTVLWPRLGPHDAASLLDDYRLGQPLTPDVTHPRMTFGSVGTQASRRSMDHLREAVLDCATGFGWGHAPLAQESAFDAAVSQRVRVAMDITWSEGSNRDVWSFVALVVLPDVTAWRWGGSLQHTNPERWIGRDLTRHTWARLWWRVVAYGDRSDLLLLLNESELNQLVERRSISGRQEFLVAFTEEILGAIEAGAPRRGLIRDVTKRARRRLTFVEVMALSPAELQSLCASLVRESLAAMASGAD